MRWVLSSIVILAASMAHADDQEAGGDTPPSSDASPDAGTTDTTDAATTDTTGAAATGTTDAATTGTTDGSTPGDSDSGSEGRGADKGTLGVGLIIGEPTGISAKLYVQNDQAIQGAAGFALIGSGLHIHADYVFHPVILQSRDSFVLLAYLGPGARVIQYRDGARGDSPSHIAIGVRGVGGLLFDFTEVPLDAFVEVAGVLEYGFDDQERYGIALNAAAGARYYF